MAAEPTVTTQGPFKVTKIPLKEAGEHIYAAAYSPDGKFLAVTFGNGSLRIFNAETFQSLQRGKMGGGMDDVPSTGVKWRPRTEESEEGVYELISVSSGGAIAGWNFDVSDPNAVYLDRTWRIAEQGNETAVCDYAPDGSLVATAGSDRMLRTYDPNTRKFVAILDKGHDETGHSRPAHTNRIFSLRFATPHTIVSGGWETPVQIWDVRTGKSERQLQGPAVSSDSLEVNDGSQNVIIASKRDNKQIMVFDYLSARESVGDSEKFSKNIGKTGVTSVRYSPEGQLVWAVTTKPDTVMAISAPTGDVKGVVEDLGILLCMEKCPTNPKRVVVGGMKESLYAVDIE